MASFQPLEAAPSFFIVASHGHRQQTDEAEGDLFLSVLTPPVPVCSYGKPALLTFSSVLRSLG